MECTVPVEVHLATEHADVGSLERTVDAALAEVGIALWRALVTQLEASCRARHLRGVWRPVKANGRGRAAWWRSRARSAPPPPVPLHCLRGHRALDAALGLEPRIEHTLGVRERGLWLVTQMTYAKAVETAAELRGWPVGRSELHRWVAQEGAVLEAARAADTEAILAPIPTAGPAATGWHGLGQRRRHDGPRPGDRHRSRGQDWPRVRRGPPDRSEPPGADGSHPRRRHGDLDRLRRAVHRAVRRLGVYEADRICFVSDGAASIRWIRERSFPTAIELLDWYHLVEALRRAIGDERPDRLDLALAAAGPGDAEGLGELLAGWAYEDAGADLARSDKLTAVWGYVANNRRAIENYAIVPLASSGPMEKAVDIVVARRFKARGMSWFRRGVSALVRLRLLRLNGTWTHYWAGRFAALLRPWPAPA